MRCRRWWGGCAGYVCMRVAGPGDGQAGPCRGPPCIAAALKCSTRRKARWRLAIARGSYMWWWRQPCCVSIPLSSHSLRAAAQMSLSVSLSRNSLLISAAISSAAEHSGPGR